MRALSAVVCAGLFAAALAAAQAPSPAAEAEAAAVKLEKIVTAAGVENREPVGEASSFTAGKVFCWVKLAIAEPPAKVKFAWTEGGKPAGDYEATIAFSSARWWASKTVWPGSWKVEVLTEAGESLGSAEFTVTKE